MGALTSLLLGSLSVSLALQTPITASVALEDFMKEIQSMQQSRTLTEETYYAAAEKAAARLDYKTLSLSDALQVADTPLIETPSGYAGLKLAHATLKPTTEEDKFQHAVLGVYVHFATSRDGKSSTKDEAKKALGALFDQPAVAKGLNSVQAAGFFNAAMAASEHEVFDEGHFKKYASVVERGFSPEQFGTIAQTWKSWRDSHSTAKSMDSLWSSIHKGMTSALAAAEKATPPNPRLIAGLKRAVSEMESPAGRGKLLNHAAPAVTFKWCSDPAYKSLADLKGKVVVLDFWATWCGPCIASMPKLRELTEHYKGKDVVVLAVTSVQGVFVENGKQTRTEGKPDEEIAMFPGYMQRQNINWVVAVSDQDVFNPDFGVDGIPHMAVIDAKGVVRHTGLHPGALTLAQKQNLIDPLLREAK